MLNSGKNFRALRDKKNNILTLVLSEKKFLNETKNHNKVKWSVPKFITGYDEQMCQIFFFVDFLPPLVYLSMIL